MGGNYLLASDEFGEWAESLRSRTRAERFAVGAGVFERIEVGPNLVTLIGGAPGVGKTALTMQMVTDAVRLDDDLRVAILNVETPWPALLERQLARISGVSVGVIRSRDWRQEDEVRIATGLDALESIAGRIAFVNEPHSITNLADTTIELGVGLVVVDYVQRITPLRPTTEGRASIEETMGRLRILASSGVAVIAVAAVGRQKGLLGGSTYETTTPSLAAFRGSSELEFGADDAYVLTHEGDGSSVGRAVVLHHLKARHREQETLKLRFNGRLQKFEDPKEAV